MIFKTFLQARVPLAREPKPECKKSYMGTVNNYLSFLLFFYHKKNPLAVPPGVFKRHIIIHCL